ncbi:MAG TPA: cupin [Stellaceae bacterium]|jgi:uncharacterized protein YjlB|nr:cupin [Stellaceae bacterium]
MTTSPKPTATKPSAPLTYVFQDDGTIPNNPALPFVVYRNVIDLAGTPDPETVIERTFALNGWGDMWRNGIYPYAHYHSMIHETMGVARGRAKVRFGGENGQEIEIVAGDVVILPAGTGHQRLTQSDDLTVVGAYPPAGKYDLCRGSKADHQRALTSIPNVPLPAADPVFGSKGPLIALWRA